jgi:hypothetical protein
MICMKSTKLITVTALALFSLSLASLSLAQSSQVVIRDQTVWVTFDEGESDAHAISRFASQAVITEEQAIQIAQQALFKFTKPDSVTLSLEHESDSQHHFLVWKVVFGEFVARVNAGTGYALTGYVDNEN